MTLLLALLAAQDHTVVTWKKHVLSEVFTCEGAAAGDFGVLRAVAACFAELGQERWPIGIGLARDQLLAELLAALRAELGDRRRWCRDGSLRGRRSRRILRFRDARIAALHGAFAALELAPLASDAGDQGHCSHCEKVTPSGHAPSKSSGRAITRTVAQARRIVRASRRRSTRQAARLAALRHGPPTPEVRRTRLRSLPTTRTLGA